MTIEQQILDELKRQNKSCYWLAKQISVSNMHVHYVLKATGRNKRELSASMKSRIEQALQKEFKPAE